MMQQCDACAILSASIDRKRTQLRIRFFGRWAILEEELLELLDLQLALIAHIKTKHIEGKDHATLSS